MLENQRVIHPGRALLLKLLIDRGDAVHIGGARLTGGEHGRTL